MEFESVVIGSRDVDSAVQTYELLLGVEHVRASGGVPRFPLVPGAVEIEWGDPGLLAVRFVAPQGEGPAGQPSPTDFHGLRARMGPRVFDAGPGPAREDAVEAVDHVVVHTPDVDRAVSLWRDRIGLRLALDRTFPNRGLRMLFFRSAGVTLEFVGSAAPAPDPSGPDRLYGVAYRVPNLSACRARLLDAGIEMSEVREGQKPDTLVATVRSGTAGVPTLLIQDQAVSGGKA